MKGDWHSLTQRQLEFLHWLCNYLYRHNQMPTIREIGKGLCIASPNGVMCHINALERKGFISSNENRSARAWHIVAVPPSWVLLPGGGIVPRDKVPNLIAELREALELEPLTCV